MKLSFISTTGHGYLRVSKKKFKEVYEDCRIILPVHGRERYSIEGLIEVETRK